MVDLAKISLSGIKPTHIPHWGNYFGMIHPAIALAQSCDTYYFIADYHALTSPRSADENRSYTHQTLATLIASGMDPEKTVLWRQSDVPEVLELTWMLSCVTGYGLMERAHSFKDARAKGKDVNFGVVSYPALMAADILLYDSDFVPVGKDQTQHLEMTRDMVGYFNQQYLGSTCHDEDGVWDGRGLKRPIAVVQEDTGVIPGLDGRKMSKSYDNHVPIFGPKKALKKRVMSIVTDSTPLEDPKDPDSCNVFALYKHFATEEEQAALAEKYRGGNFGYGHAKLELFEKSQAYFGPKQERFDALMSDTGGLEEVLQAGAKKARSVAQKVLGRAREAMGLPSRLPFPGA